jgi:preprotein translocase subunit SecF
MLFLFSQYITSIILIIGLILLISGFVLTFIPFFKQYKLPIQILGILIFSYGIYLQGGIAVENKYKLEVAELQNKLKEAEVKAETVNTKIVTQVVTRREVIKEKGNDVIKYIDREVVKYDNTCTIPEIVIKSHDLAAKNQKPNEEVLTENTVIETKSHNEIAKPMLLPKK